MLCYLSTRAWGVFEGRWVPKRAVETRFSIWNGSNTFLNGGFEAQSVSLYCGGTFRAYSSSCVKPSTKSRTFDRLASGVREALLSYPDSHRAQSSETLQNAWLVSNIYIRGYRSQN